LAWVKIHRVSSFHAGHTGTTSGLLSAPTVAMCAQFDSRTVSAFTYSGDFTGSEWAGATFEPKNGNWLFVNIQTPGITFAITGPWQQGSL
jgi:secreted PhoX family phosphatase